jgi:hypothetical protein
MPAKDRRLSVSDRRHRTRGGRRQTDYRSDTASGLLCEHCDHGIAQLVTVSPVNDEIELLYRCPGCGEESIRSVAAEAGEPQSQ